MINDSQRSFFPPFQPLPGAVTGAWFPLCTQKKGVWPSRSPSWVSAGKKLKPEINGTHYVYNWISKGRVPKMPSPNQIIWAQSSEHSELSSGDKECVPSPARQVCWVSLAEVRQPGASATFFITLKNLSSSSDSKDLHLYRRLQLTRYLRVHSHLIIRRPPVRGEVGHVIPSNKPGTWNSEDRDLKDLSKGNWLLRSRSRTWI